MPIQKYLKCQPAEIQNKLMPIIIYINNTYPNAIFDELYSDKTHIPTYRYNNSYVAIGCRKYYISIYFGTENAASEVAKTTPYCRALKGCVNLSYKREIPYDSIYIGIDYCFKNNI